MKHHPSITARRRAGSRAEELARSPRKKTRTPTSSASRYPARRCAASTAQEYKDGTYVVSGSQLLQCSRGVWIESAASDPRNL